MTERFPRAVPPARLSAQPLTPTVGVAALSSPLEVGAERAAPLASDLATLLEGAGCRVVCLGSIDTPEMAASAGRRMAELHVDAIVLAAASWFEDYLVLDVLEECPAPVLLWALPGIETGALCGTQQATAFLKYLDCNVRCVYGQTEDSDCLGRAMAFLRAARLHSVLRRARVGLAGSRVNGMSHASANEFALKKAVGARIVNLDMPDIIERVDAVGERDAGVVWDGIRNAAGCCKVPDTEGTRAARFYLALREVADQHGLNAMAVGCYPRLMGKICLAASLLADEGLPLACEGDVHGALGQLILTLLTGQPTHNTDWLEPLADGTVVFTHCGSGSFSLAARKEDIVLGPVRLMNEGVCGLFPAKPGPVTLVSLVPHGDGYQCAVLEGEAVATEMVFPGNPAGVRFSLPADQLIEWIYAEGISHHWMIGYGHVAAEIREWASIAGPALRLVEPE